MNLRRPRPPANIALDLLSQLPARLTASVTHHGLPPARRTVQVRGNTLLLFRRSAPTLGEPLRHDALHTVLSLSALRPSLPSPHAASVWRHGSLRLTFRNAADGAALAALVRSVHVAPTYSTTTVLGHGATATVHLATSSSPSAPPAAVKLLPKLEALDSSEHLHQLLEERSALLALRSSPHALRLQAAYQTPSHFALVTELAHYGDLHDIQRLLPNGRFSPSAARILVAELVLALMDVHRSGRLFRDLKPANVLLSKTGHVRLADFGLAKRLPIMPKRCPSMSTVTDGSDADDCPSDNDEVTFQQPPPRFAQRANSFVGTRRFMSPEVVALGSSRRGGYDTGADVWALGVTLFVLLTGRHPFGEVRDRDVVSLLHSITTDEMVVPETVDADAADLLRKMLNKDSLERIDLAGVRAHPWFKEVDWIEVRRNVKMDVECEEVLQCLKEAEVASVVERAGRGTKAHSGLSEKVSAVSVSDAEEVANRVGNWELLGFEYLGAQL